MAPLLPILITLTLSCASPALAQYGYEDNGGYGSPSYYAEQQRQHEQKMQQYRAEEQASYFRQQQDTARINEPTHYGSPSYEPSTHSFTFSSGNEPQDMKLCTASKYTVSCF